MSELLTNQQVACTPGGSDTINCVKYDLHRILTISSFKTVKECLHIENPNIELLTESYIGNLSGVKFVLENCNTTNINIQNVNGQTPLMFASKKWSCQSGQGPS